MGTVIEGIKLIKHNAVRCNRPDDPSYPFKLEAIFRAPDFMAVTFAYICGPNEEIVVRGMTAEALSEFADRNNLRTHTRLRRFTITGPDGVVEQIKK